MSTMKFKITNITCPACVTLSIGALKEIPGVTEAQVDLKSGEAMIQAERAVNWTEINEALRQVNKEATLITE